MTTKKQTVDDLMYQFRNRLNELATTGRIYARPTELEKAADAGELVTLRPITIGQPDGKRKLYPGDPVTLRPDSRLLEPERVTTAARWRLNRKHKALTKLWQDGNEGLSFQYVDVTNARGVVARQKAIITDLEAELVQAREELAALEAQCEQTETETAAAFRAALNGNIT